ncbi:MAG: creatininase family protein [Maribacter sp.]
MHRPYILAEANWESLREERFDLAILPWGATEAHNYHLPYGTDNYQAESMVELAAKGAWEKGKKVIVLPTLPYGVNTGQKDIYLDINLNPSTQLAILKDIVTVLNRQGIYKLLLFNGHGGNDFKPIIRELGLLFPKMFISFCFFPKMLDKAAYFQEKGDHADEMETSLMLYLRPDLVLEKEKWGRGEEKKIKIDGYNQGWVWAERQWSKVSADTGIGNPEHATPEKGEQFFNDICAMVDTLMCSLCDADLNDLYA